MQFDNFYNKENSVDNTKDISLYIPGRNDYFFLNHIRTYFDEKNIELFSADLQNCGKNRNNEYPHYISNLKLYYPVFELFFQKYKNKNHIYIFSLSTGAISILDYLSSNSLELREKITLTLIDPLVVLHDNNLLTKFVMNNPYVIPFTWNYKILWIDIDPKIPISKGGKNNQDLDRLYQEYNYDLEKKSITTVPTFGIWLLAVNESINRIKKNDNKNLEIFLFTSNKNKTVDSERQHKYIKSINENYKGYNILNSEYHNLLADKKNRCKEIKVKDNIIIWNKSDENDKLIYQEILDTVIKKESKNNIQIRDYDLNPINHKTDNPIHNLEHKRDIVWYTTIFLYFIYFCIFKFIIKKYVL